jgi:hypothetical protein
MGQVLRGSATATEAVHRAIRHSQESLRAWPSATASTRKRSPNGFGDASMARTIGNSKIDTRSARAKLAKRREPYWTVISKGCALGYRKLDADRGTWIARFRDAEGKQHYEALGATDDALDARGAPVLTFAQAQECARKFFNRKPKEIAGDVEPDGPYTIAEAIEAYFTDRERPAPKGWRRTAPRPAYAFCLPWAEWT